MQDDTPISATEWCLRLARAQAVLTRRLDNALGGHHGISFSDYQMLYHLSRAPGARLRRIELAERLGLTASGVTRNLLPLEKIGLVTRQSDPRDARVGFAVVTATGQELMNNATTVVDSIARDALGQVTLDIRTRMAALLGQIAGIHSGNS